jgi:hypothetical protein
MTDRVVLMVVLCLPAWAVLTVLGPIQLLTDLRIGGILHPGLLMSAAIFGFPISLVTTPIAIFLMRSFARTAQSQREVKIYVILAMSALAGTLVGAFIVWRLSILRF